MNNSIPSRHQQQLSRWQAILVDCHKKGIAVKKYVREHHLKESSYYYWRDELWMEGIEVFPGFLESRAGASSLHIERRLRNHGSMNSIDHPVPEFARVPPDVISALSRPAEEAGPDKESPDCSLKIHAGIFSIEFTEKTSSSLLHKALMTLKEVEA